MNVRVDIVVDDPSWRLEGREFLTRLRRAVRFALESEKTRAACGLTILLADDATLAGLNVRFRGKRGATNVLSFPSGREDYWGDVAIAHGVAAREAASAGKLLRDHALHLAVHGTLHLLGYEHETVRQARVMEPLEVRILAKLGLGDPYAAMTTAAAD